MIEDILTLSKKLISVQSVSGRKAELTHVLDLIKEELQQEFFIEEFIRNDTKSLLITNTQGKQRNFNLIFNAHVDIVEGEIEQFTPYEKNQRLYGRGSYDMKSAAAVMILLFKKVAKKVPYPFGIQLVTDEELGGSDGTGYQVEQGVRANFIICGEMTNFHIGNQSKGALRFRLQTKGITAHGAYPWKGDNAIAKLLESLHILNEKYQNPKEEAWISTINLAKIETSNTSYNRIPDNATAYVEIRFLHEEAAHIEQTVQSLLPQDVSLKCDYIVAPAYTDPKNPSIQLLRKCITSITGKKIKIQSAHGASDIHFYSKANCPGVEFGPKGANHHAKDEWVDIQSLTDYAKILERFLFSLSTNKVIGNDAS